MKIIKNKKYIKDIQKKIINKHMKKELETINKIEELMINTENMKDLMLNPFSKVYKIEKKERKSERNIYSENKSKDKNVHKTNWRISISVRRNYRY